MKVSSLCVSMVLLADIGDAFVAPFKTATFQTVQSKRTSTITSTTSTPFHTTTITSSSIILNGSINDIAETIVQSSSAPLSQYFWQAVIDNGIPALFSIITIAVAAFFFKKSREGKDSASAFLDNINAVDELYSDLYGSSASSKSPLGGSPFGGPPGGLSKKQKRNLGVPSTQYIQINNLNEKYASYDFSLQTATASKAAAASEYRSQAFDRALQKALTPFGGATNMAGLPGYTKNALLIAEKKFLTGGKKLVGEIQELEAQLVKASMDAEISKMGMKMPHDPKPVEMKADNTTTDDTTTDKNEDIEKMQKQNKKLAETVTKDLAKLQSELQQLELEFVQQAVTAVGPERAIGFRSALLKDVEARGTGGLLKQLGRRPLSAFFQNGNDDDAAATASKSLFVMKFPGDVTASQLNELREEVTAIIRNVKPGDEALLILQSGGGTVTGYGLAAGQLVRLREKGVFLTIAVEQVAASGGYMMTCVADKIIASPFAVLGSIGVITEIPNAYERLKKEGIEFQTVTAGEFKRTLTPTKKINKEDFNKAKQDVEMILEQFSGFVAKNRPQLDIKSVATGETWFGNAAMEKGLCDEIRPVDDVLLRYVDDGYQVYEIAYKAPQSVPEGLFALLPSTSTSTQKGNTSFAKSMVRWVASSFMEEFKEALYESGTVQETQRYMAKDETADQMKIEEGLW